MTNEQLNNRIPKDSKVHFTVQPEEIVYAMKKIGIHRASTAARFVFLRGLEVMQTADKKALQMEGAVL